MPQPRTSERSTPSPKSARPTTRHPFASGSKRVAAFRKSILARDSYTCRMCGVILTAGKHDDRAAVVDHIRPVSLCPDLAWDADNCWALCRRCHATCDGIEKRLSPDADAIAKTKQVRYATGVDGWPV